MFSASFKKASLLTAATALLVGVAGSAAAPRGYKGLAPVPRITVPVITGGTIRDVTKELSSDRYEGRGPGSRAEDLTITYIVNRFKAAGLQPGNKGSWLQNVPTVDITAKNADGLTVNAGGQKLHFDYGSDMVVGSYRVTPQTRIKDASLVFVGYGINAPELGWNDYAGVDMKGKIAVILVNDPDYETADESGLFKGRRMTYYGRWTYKFEEAARQARWAR